MFGRRERARPLSREQLSALEDLRDDCIALFVNSGLRQRDIQARGGPTAQTISRWLYKETHFPRYSTIESFLLALGYGLTPMRLEDIQEQRRCPLSERLDLDVEFAGRPRMPKRVRRDNAR